MYRLTSILARVKLKESDCGFTTAWAMGLNSTVREQPYLGLALVLKEEPLVGVP